ncbi:MAG TPA: DUF2911 domain-containing protein [Gemmatimonadales bacterium]|jgi:hypothetical protein|nr:DUF2911 domain-containing protein [Gemmatimonadales bacterium]
MTRDPRLATLLLALLALPSCKPEQSWGYVATLGNDTTSVERVTQRGNHITGDAVGRSPTVVRRHWEMTLAPDGGVSRWVMDSRIPNAPAGERELHHEFEREDGELRIVRRNGKGGTDRTGPEPWTRVVPWNAFLYSTYDQLIQDARGLPDSTRIGLYFFEGWHEGSVGFGRVREIGEGRYSIMSTGLAGLGEARVDESGRMVSYSGDGTTYKQEVRRVTDIPDLDALFQRYAADELKRGAPRALSIRDTARGTVGKAQITVDYSRPLQRGRVLVGGLIPYGQVWRTGANAATQLTTSAPITLAGVALDSGTYTLWTFPSESGVQLIINREHGQWGTEYNAQYDIARVPMKVDTTQKPVEKFTIRIGSEPSASSVSSATSVDPSATSVDMEWGRFRWSVPISGQEVHTKTRKHEKAVQR